MIYPLSCSLSRLAHKIHGTVATATIHGYLIVAIMEYHCSNKYQRALNVSYPHCKHCHDHGLSDQQGSAGESEVQIYILQLLLPEVQ